LPQKKRGIFESRNYFWAKYRCSKRGDNKTTNQTITAKVAFRQLEQQRSIAISKIPFVIKASGALALLLQKKSETKQQGQL